MKCANDGTRKIEGLRKPCTKDVEPIREEHGLELCSACAKRKGANIWKAQKHQAMKSLGLTPVRGAMSGKLYWE